MKNDNISYSRHYIDKKDISSVINVLKSNFITQGPLVTKFEKLLSKYVGSKYCVAVNSGTAALHTALLAIDLKPGDEVITSPLTFAATSNAVIYTGAKPVFSDVDEYGLLDPNNVLDKISRKTRAIITVDYAGHPSHLENLRKISKKYNLVLIEDAAHALGSQYNNKRVGSVADLTCFSFHPVKIITTGEGGAITTNNSIYYKKMLLFKSHGITKKADDFTKEYEGPWHQEMLVLGYNYRISEIQLALGISQLSKIDNFINERIKIYSYYNSKLQGLEKKGLLTLPPQKTNVLSTWHLYPLRIDFVKIGKSKKKLFNFFQKNGVKLQVHYPPVHMHPYYIDKFRYKIGDFPIAEEYYRQEVSIPIYPKIKKTQLNLVVSLLNKFLLGD